LSQAGSLQFDDRWPPPLAELVTRCLKSDPILRPGSGEMADELEDICRRYHCHTQRELAKWLETQYAVAFAKHENLERNSLAELRESQQEADRTVVLPVSATEGRTDSVVMTSVRTIVLAPAGSSSTQPEPAKSKARWQSVPLLIGTAALAVAVGWWMFRGNSATQSEPSNDKAPPTSSASTSMPSSTNSPPPATAEIAPEIAPPFTSVSREMAVPSKPAMESKTASVFKKPSTPVLSRKSKPEAPKDNLEAGSTGAVSAAPPQTDVPITPTDLRDPWQ
jgi:hypothetical protein